MVGQIDGQMDGRTNGQALILRFNDASKNDRSVILTPDVKKKKLHNEASLAPEFLFLFCVGGVRQYRGDFFL